MTEKELKKFRKLLLDLRLALQADLQKDLSNEVGDVGVQDIVDEASNMASKVQVLGLVEQTNNKIRAVSQALDRMDNGTYGICEVCDDDIPVKRLELIPYAALCAECQEDSEKESK